ncbi:hypothetical protein [Stenotrophomonas sp. GZD-301]|uniref:hypothetical protein n=1 Tax=Stenotrophomonas sp. GZD-301 TaxID=3404814 RepID=UPI003BB614CC
MTGMKGVVGIALGLLLAGAAAAHEGVGTQSVVTTRADHAAGSSQAQGIEQWLAQVSPDRPAMLSGGAFTVSRTYPAAGSASGADLPAQGVAGESRTITRRLPAGDTERWQYVWQNGRWTLGAYDYVSAARNAARRR